MKSSILDNAALSFHIHILLKELISCSVCYHTPDYSVMDSAIDSYTKVKKTIYEIIRKQMDVQLSRTD